MKVKTNLKRKILNQKVNTFSLSKALYLNSSILLKQRLVVNQIHLMMLCDEIFPKRQFIRSPCFVQATNNSTHSHWRFVAFRKVKSMLKYVAARPCVSISITCRLKYSRKNLKTKILSLLWPKFFLCAALSIRAFPICNFNSQLIVNQQPSSFLESFIR